MSKNCVNRAANGGIAHQHRIYQPVRGRQPSRPIGAVRRPGRPDAPLCEAEPGPGLAGEQGPGAARSTVHCPLSPVLLGGQGRSAAELGDVAQASLLMLGAMAVITVGAILLGDWVAEFVAW